MFSSIHIYLYVLPLVAVISVVYTATRYEDLTRIVKQSIRLFGVIMGVLALATAFLLVVNSLI